MSKITPSLEDYLESIYNISLENGIVRVTDIALDLSIAKPSVNKAVSILKERGYVNHEYYGNIELTEEGKKMALYVKNKHNAILSFLNLVLGVDDQTAEIEACKIEHVISDNTIEKMIDYMKKIDKYEN